MNLRPFLYFVVLIVAGCHFTSGNKTDANLPLIKNGLTPGLVAEDKVILFLGSDIAAGYGIPASEAYPDIIRNVVDSLNWPFRIINAGLRNDSSQAGIGRIDYFLDNDIDVLVLSLVLNDARARRNPQVIRANLQAIIEKVRSKNVDVKFVIANVLISNMDSVYAAQLTTAMRELAAVNQAEFIPDILAGVSGIDTLTQADQINPTARGQEIVALNVWKVLKPTLEDLLKEVQEDNQAAAMRYSSTPSRASKSTPSSNFWRPTFP